MVGEKEGGESDKIHIVLCQSGNTEGAVTEEVMKDRQVIDALEGRGKAMSTGLKSAKQHYSPNSVISIREDDVESRRGTTNTSLAKVL